MGNQLNKQIVDRKTLYDGYHKFEMLKISNKDGIITEREFLNNKDGVCALVYNTITQKYIFVKQWRPVLNDKMIEIPGGACEKHENPEDAISREITEETGYKIDKVKFVKSFYVSPGTISEKVYLYYAEVSEQISTKLGRDDENEEIELIEISKGEIRDFEFIDVRTILAIRLIKMIELNKIINRYPN